MLNLDLGQKLVKAGLEVREGDSWLTSGGISVRG